MHWQFGIGVILLGYFASGDVSVMGSGYWIRSYRDNMYLDVYGGTAEGKPVVTWQGNEGDQQQWKVDDPNLFYNGVGSSLTPVSQDGGRIKVLDEDQGSNLVAVWGNANQSNQKWKAQPCYQYDGISLRPQYQIINMRSGRCLTSVAYGQVKTTPCMALDQTIWTNGEYGQVWDFDVNSPRNG